MRCYSAGTNDKVNSSSHQGQDVVVRAARQCVNLRGSCGQSVSELTIVVMRAGKLKPAEAKGITIQSVSTNLILTELISTLHHKVGAIGQSRHGLIDPTKNTVRVI